MEWNGAGSDSESILIKSCRDSWAIGVTGCCNIICGLPTRIKSQVIVKRISLSTGNGSNITLYGIPEQRADAAKVNNFCVAVLLCCYFSLRTFNSSFSWYRSGESSGTKPMPLSENEAEIPRTRDRLSHWSPCPRSTRTTFGPNTRATVTDVESCVRMKPSKYLMSGPACGNINKLQEKHTEVRKCASAGEG